jgi:hypothetical protein
VAEQCLPECRRGMEVTHNSPAWPA